MSEFSLHGTECADYASQFGRLSVNERWSQEFDLVFSPFENRYYSQEELFDHYYPDARYEEPEEFEDEAAYLEHYREVYRQKEDFEARRRQTEAATAALEEERNRLAERWRERRACRCAMNERQAAEDVAEGHVYTAAKPCPMHPDLRQGPGQSSGSSTSTGKGKGKAEHKSAPIPIPGRETGATREHPERALFSKPVRLDTQVVTTPSVPKPSANSRSSPPTGIIDSFGRSLGSTFQYKPSGQIPPASSAMQMALSLPNLNDLAEGSQVVVADPRSPAPITNLLHEPSVLVLAHSPATGVVIAEALEVPEILRPRSQPGSPIRPKLITRPSTPGWAMPPLTNACVRGRFDETMPRQYYAVAQTEFGSTMLEETNWQELLKSSEGRIVVKTDEQRYVVTCYLPGDCTMTVHHSGAATLNVQATIASDHFHWRLSLPHAAFELKIEVDQVGSEYRITIPRKSRKKRPCLLLTDSSASDASSSTTDSADDDAPDPA